MITLHHSPTEKITDIFGNFLLLEKLISSYIKRYEQFEIKFFFTNSDRKKITCNISALIEYLSKHDADCIYVYGSSCGDKTLLIEKDHNNFVVFYEPE